MYNQEEITEKIKILLPELEGKLIEREEIIRLVILAIFAKHHVFLIGVPGVAKTKLLKTVTTIVKDASFWERLMTSGTQEYHMVGHEHSGDAFSRFLSVLQPESMLEYLKSGSNLIVKAFLSFLNLSSLVDKSKETSEAEKKESLIHHEFVLLDEMFKAPVELLVSLLSVMNERVFTSKGKAIPVKLRSMFSASNELPKGEKIEPFVDRILIWFEVKSIQNGDNFIKYINGAFDTTSDTSVNFNLNELEYAFINSREVTLPEYIQNIYTSLERAIDKDGIRVSNRKFGPDYIISLLKICAWLNGRDNVDISDLFLIRHCAWYDYVSRDKLFKVVHDVLFENKEKTESTVNQIVAEQEANESFFNHNLASFLNYDESFFGETGENDYRIRIEQLNGYFNGCEYLLKSMAEVEKVRLKSIETLQKCEENLFVYGVECKTFSNKTITDIIQRFIAKKEMEIQNLQKWYNNNSDMSLYQMNQNAIRTGRGEEVKYSFV